MCYICVCHSQLYFTFLSPSVKVQTKAREPRRKINKVGVQINTGQITLAGMKGFVSELEKPKEKREGDLSFADQVEFTSFRSPLAKPTLKT